MNSEEDVRKIVNNWSPKKKYSKETEYRDDLVEFIRGELNRPQKSFLRLFVGTQKHRVKKEAGRVHADIEIDRNIGIELKRNLKGKTEMDRLYGQISEYEREYECIIVVLCGEVREETVEELEYRLEQIDSGWGTVLDEPKVTIVRKDEAVIKGKEKKKK